MKLTVFTFIGIATTLMALAAFAAEQSNQARAVALCNVTEPMLDGSLNTTTVKSTDMKAAQGANTLSRIRSKPDGTFELLVSVGKFKAIVAIAGTAEPVTRDIEGGISISCGVIERSGR